MTYLVTVLHCGTFVKTYDLFADNALEACNEIERLYQEATPYELAFNEDGKRRFNGGHTFRGFTFEARQIGA